MGEGSGMNKRIDVGDEQDMDVHEAAQILEQAQDKARHELKANHPAIFLTWGLVYLLGYGAIWLSVRGQHPYTAPAPAAIAGIFALAALALAITAAVVSRAVSGVGGASDVQRRGYYLTIAIGYVGTLVLEAALVHAGASQEVRGIYGAASPILLIGLVFAASAANRSDRSVMYLGVWLLGAAALSGFAGPAGVWGVLALAVGAGFLAMAAVSIKQDRL
jgi:hypothetical protein